MSTVDELLTTVDTTYRNSFTDAVKVEYMDTTQKQIYQRVKHEAEPYTFPTVSGSDFYPLPDDCDPKGIKQVSIETKADSDKYITLRYVSLESNEMLSEQDLFYGVLKRNLFLNPMPTTATAGKNVYMYYNKRPADLSSTVAGLLLTPDLEEDFHELLVLGCLVRIARARQEGEDQAMFLRDYQLLLKDYIDQFKVVFPEFPQQKDVSRSRRRGSVYMRGGRFQGRRLSELIPDS